MDLNRQNIEQVEENSKELFYPSTKQEWRAWLHENHDKKQSVWLVCYKKKSNIPSVPWGDSVDEALCYGWIDSVRKTLDGDRYIQFFSKRKVGSTWSKVNKAKVEKFIADGTMMPAGFASIELAKQNGSWNILDEVEELIVPNDLEEAFNHKAGSKDYFLGLSKSVKKAMLQWIVLAKRPETRQKRIEEIAELAGEGKRPKQF